MLIKAKDFWKKYEPKIVLVLGFILVASLSFEMGLLGNQKGQNEPIIIEKPVESQITEKQAIPDASGAQKSSQEAVSASISSNVVPQNCVYLASKNSTIYHLPTCSYAKRIKPENRVCFSSENEAVAKGYQPDKKCIK